LIQIKKPPAAMRLMAFYEREKAAEIQARLMVTFGGDDRSRESHDQGLSFAPAFVALAPDLDGTQ
jgi:hypothetical protein